MMFTAESWMAGSRPAMTTGVGWDYRGNLAGVQQARREDFCGLARSVVRSVRTYVSTREFVATAYERQDAKRPRPYRRNRTWSIQKRSMRLRVTFMLPMS